MTTAQGCYVSQSVRRVPEARRFDSQLLEAITGTPWQPRPGSEDLAERLPLLVSLVPDIPEAPAMPVEAGDVPRQVRRYYITTKDLTLYGYTDGCAACDVTRASLPRTGVFHSPGCRERIEKAIEFDPNEDRDSPEHRTRSRTIVRSE